MTEKKGDMATNTNKNPKKANLLDHHSIKHLLDESVSEIVRSRGYIENVRMSNIRLLIGTIIIVIALFAQFYNKKFPDNKMFLIGCIILYVLCNGILQLIIYTKEKNAILFTYPPVVVTSCSAFPKGQPNSVMVTEPDGIYEGQRLVYPCEQSLSKTSGRSLAIFFWGSFNSTGLVVSSKLPRFSDMYTLTIASSDPQSISAKPPVELTKSVTQWFTKEGVLVEGLFWKDVEGLVNDYAKEAKKSK